MSLRTLIVFFFRATVGANFMVMVIILGRVGPPPFRTMVTGLSILVQNIMGCKVFRLLKLGRIHDTPSSLGDVQTPMIFFSEVLPTSSADTRVPQKTGSVPLTEQSVTLQDDAQFSIV